MLGACLKPEEGVDLPESGIEGCEPPCRCVEVNIGPLQEQPGRGASLFPKGTLWKTVGVTGRGVGWGWGVPMEVLSVVLNSCAQATACPRHG